jgi:multiple sugar transport system ATP-binding protein
MAGITIDRVAKDFGSHRALHELSLEIADGELIALLGPSGCGKTTLLRIIAGLETSSAGRILIGGKDISGLPPRQRGLAMVFQNYAIFPHMTVAQNIAFGLKMQNKPDDVIKRQVAKAAGLLHIEQYLERYPAKLSGGQRQRVAVARALAVEPQVLLMDEPLSNLDALLRLEMRTELKSVLRAAGTTTVYVTHDQTEAMGLADRIAVMYGGRIEQIASPQVLYEKPSTRFVGGFIGNPPMNFIDCDVKGGIADVAGGRIKAPVADGKVVLGLRAEDATVGPLADGAIPFEVRVVEPMGSHMLLTGTIAGQLARIGAPPTMKIDPGTKVGLRVDADRVTWIDPQSGKAQGR